MSRTRSASALLRRSALAERVRDIQDSIGERLIHRRPGQFDQELAEALREYIHQPASLAGGGGGGVAEAGVGRDQMPGPGETHPAAIDRLESTWPCLPRVRQLRPHQVWEIS